MTAKTKRASEPRRANKPLMEKRRRARINQSLAALKTLILDSAKADNTKHSKLEKADILELTVRHFQRHRSLDVKGVNQYKAGYSDCVREVQRYLDTPDAQTMTVIDTGVRQRLLRHLDNCISEVDMDVKLANNSLPQPTTEDRLHESNANHEVNNNEKLQQKTTTATPTSTTTNNNNCNNNKQEVECASQKNCDGNFVLLLPEHYLQLANVLGMNLRQHQQPQHSEKTTVGTSDGKIEPVCSKEKPLDFSNANENKSMWRPW